MQPKQGVRSRHTSHQQVSTTLEILVTSEAQEGTRQSIACLVRLIRYVSPVSLCLRTGLLAFVPARMCSGLLFTCRALENMQADQTSELQVCFQRSYDDVLKHHHGWLVQSAITVRADNAPFEFSNKSLFLFHFSGSFLAVLQLAIKTVPSRSEFYRRISQGGSHEKLDTELGKWLAGLNRIVVHMKRFLEEGGHGTV